MPGTPVRTAATALEPPPASPPLRASLAGFFGTTLEWYDYFLYGSAAALVFPKLFFTGLTEPAGTIVSLATFSVAFLLRPVGGVIFGHFGDRLGRKRMLIVTLSLMGASTFLIGLLPTRDQIGLAAPILLVLLRVVQGLALGGEWGGAALVAVENAPTGRRGRYGVGMQMGVPAGQLLSSGLLGAFSVLPDASFYSPPDRPEHRLLPVHRLLGDLSDLSAAPAVPATSSRSTPISAPSTCPSSSTTTGRPARSAPKASASSVPSASPQRSPTRSSTPPGSGCAGCRSGCTTCSTSGHPDDADES